MRIILIFTNLLCIHSYSTNTVVEIANAIFDKYFTHTIIGDCDFANADPDVLCPAVMEGSGECTMAQMFKGQPAKCVGTLIGSKDVTRNFGTNPYQIFWKTKELVIRVQRKVAYKERTKLLSNALSNLKDKRKANKLLLEAGEKSLEIAQVSAETNGVTFGVGVCTSLAAAGMTALGRALSLRNEEFGGAQIRFLRESYPGTGDGHEYLLVTDAEGSEQSKVLVDYWYAILDASTRESIGMKSTLLSTSDRWNFDNVKIAKDKSRNNPHRFERIYHVPKLKPLPEGTIAHWDAHSRSYYYSSGKYDKQGYERTTWHRPRNRLRKHKHREFRQRNVHDAGTRENMDIETHEKIVWDH